MGATGVSEPVSLNVVDAAGNISPYLSKEGDTLESIAGSEHVDLADLAKANPSLEDPNQVIPVDTQIDLPNPPAPVTNPNIISGFPELEMANLPPGNDQGHRPSFHRRGTVKKAKPSTPFHLEGKTAGIKHCPPSRI